MEKSESRIQQEIVRYFRNNYCLKHHEPRSMILSIPNEEKPRYVKTGLLPGAADLLVVIEGKAIFVEVKTPKGKQGPKQATFEKQCEQVGAPYFLVRSLYDFKKALGL